MILCSLPGPDLNVILRISITYFVSACAVAAAKINNILIRLNAVVFLCKLIIIDIYSIIAIE